MTKKEVKRIEKGKYIIRIKGKGKNKIRIIDFEEGKDTNIKGGD